MNEYYAELFGHGDPVIAAGWRHRLEQALRFEIALEGISVSAEGSAEGSVGSGRSLRLLDVGCGPGNLWKYLEATGRGASKIEYTGIDRLQAAVELARKRFPAADFVHRNVFEFGKDQPEQSFDAVFAIGTMVSGVDVPHDWVRLRRMIQLVERSFALSRAAFCLVVLNQEVVESRYSLQSESALLGAYPAELHALGQRLAEESGARYAVRTDFLTTDVALYLWREGTGEPTFLGEPTPFAAHERVFAGPWGQDVTTLERVWLWLEAGAYQRAEEILNSEPYLVGERAELLRSRLRAAGRWA